MKKHEQTKAFGIAGVIPCVRGRPRFCFAKLLLALGRARDCSGNPAANREAVCEELERKARFFAEQKRRPYSNFGGFLFFFIFAAGCVFFGACASQSPAAVPAGERAEETEAQMLGLDEAVRDFALYSRGRIPEDSAAAVLNVEAPLGGISDYVTDTLTENLLNVGGARMVSRQNIATVKREQRVQGDGYVDDGEAARIGHLAGWKTVVIGAVRPLTTGYRMSLRAVAVESGELLGAKNYLIKSDVVLAGIVNPNLTVQTLLRREEILKPFDGRGNDFDLSLAAGKDTFYDGEELSFSLRAAADCFFVVYQVDVNNTMRLIFPNPYDTDNRLRAGVSRTIPEHARFELHAPFGEERILVFASRQPINIDPERYEPRPLSAESVSGARALLEGDAPGGKALSVRPRGASGQFVYTILPR
jgi:hypothetical protein